MEAHPSGAGPRSESSAVDCPVPQTHRLLLMPDQIGTPNPPVEVGLVHRARAQRRPACRWAHAVRPIGVMDLAAYRAVASIPSDRLDNPFRRLSTAADRSRLWIGIATVMALLGGDRGRRAAFDGLLSIASTSAAVNLAMKPLARRRRPARVESARFAARYLPMPGSTSFPSGHAASGFAFAVAATRHLPRLAVPIRLLAGAVAYSRVHAGVHYPSDVLIGSIIGSGTAAVVTASCQSWRTRPTASRSRFADKGASGLSTAREGSSVRPAEALHGGHWTAEVTECLNSPDRRIRALVAGAHPCEHEPRDPSQARHAGRPHRAHREGPAP
jgi:membrane-associated phospholipid phosphatase